MDSYENIKQTIKDGFIESATSDENCSTEMEI